MVSLADRTRSWETHPESVCTYTGNTPGGVSERYYDRRRVYDAQLGRFVIRDPVGYEGSPRSLYEYAGSVVTSASDPSGLGGDTSGVVTADDIRWCRDKCKRKGLEYLRVTKPIFDLWICKLYFRRCQCKPEEKEKKGGYWYCLPKIEVLQMNTWEDPETGETGEYQKKMTCELVGPPQRDHSRHCTYKCPDGTSRFREPTWMKGKKLGK